MLLIGNLNLEKMIIKTIKFMKIIKSNRDDSLYFAICSSIDYKYIIIVFIINGSSHCIDLVPWLV